MCLERMAVWVKLFAIGGSWYTVLWDFNKCKTSNTGRVCVRVMEVNGHCVYSEEGWWRHRAYYRTKRNRKKVKIKDKTQTTLDH